MEPDSDQQLVNYPTSDGGPVGFASNDGVGIVASLHQVEKAYVVDGGRMDHFPIDGVPWNWLPTLMCCHVTIIRVLRLLNNGILLANVDT